MKKRALVKPSGVATREGLVALAQVTAQSVTGPYRCVVAITDVSGDWVGVGMNTSSSDALTILKCAVVGDDQVFYDKLNFARRGRNGIPSRRRARP